jgi:hypothetical protein
MRIAGRTPPWIETRPTPLTSARRCAIKVSARSLSERSGMVSEVSARVTIGASAGFTFE